MDNSYFTQTKVKAIVKRLRDRCGHIAIVSWCATISGKQRIWMLDESTLFDIYIYYGTVFFLGWHFMCEVFLNAFFFVSLKRKRKETTYVCLYINKFSL